MSNELQNSELVHHSLLNELSGLIEKSKHQVAVAVNSSLTLLFWQIGKRINDEILQNQRADYGKQIVATLSAQLERQYGRNFTEKNVRRMLKFATLFPEVNILPPLAEKLSWSHFVELFPLITDVTRMFYAHKVVKVSWVNYKIELRTHRVHF